MQSFKNELKQVLRRLGRAPLFTVITLVTLAAGVGANTVVFSVLEGVLLTYGYWRRKFGGDSSVIGRNIIVDGKSRQIIGALPQRFHFLDREDPAVITPFQFDRNKTHLGNFSYEGLARLKPGITVEQVNVDVARMLPIVMSSFAAPPGFSLKLFEDARIGPNVRPLKRDVVGDVGSVLWLLMGSIGMVLLIACANVANLLLVR